MPRFAIGGDNLFAATLAVGRLGPAGTFRHSYRRMYRRRVAYAVKPAIDTPSKNSHGAM